MPIETLSVIDIIVNIEYIGDVTLTFESITIPRYIDSLYLSMGVENHTMMIAVHLLFTSTTTAAAAAATAATEARRR